MKLPITDKFLLELYDTYQGIEWIVEDLMPPKSARQYFYRDWIKLQRSYKQAQGKRKFSQFVGYLQERGYIRVKNLEGKQGIMLTRKGLEKAFYAKCKADNKKRRKDKQWIMIMFDVPHANRGIRERLRGGLRTLGYEQLQKSVWVCPYDVYPDTERMIRLCGASDYVKTFLVKEID